MSKIKNGFVLLVLATILVITLTACVDDSNPADEDQPIVTAGEFPNIPDGAVPETGGGGGIPEDAIIEGQQEVTVDGNPGGGGGEHRFSQ